MTTTSVRRTIFLLATFGGGVLNAQELLQELDEQKAQRLAEYNSG